jgi:hypothetical protein
VRPWLVAATLTALVCCAKSESTKEKEVSSCSSITSDAQGLAQCLVMRYKWDGTDALPVATSAQRQKDSVALSQRMRLQDSMWRADSQKHRYEISQCQRTQTLLRGLPYGFVDAKCLQLSFVWPEGRAVATGDSVWQLDSAKHRQEVTRCVGLGESSPVPCLDMNYGWPTERSLAVAESLSRAKFDQGGKQPRRAP